MHIISPQRSVLGSVKEKERLKVPFVYQAAGPIYRPAFSSHLLD